MNKRKRKSKGLTQHELIKAARRVTSRPYADCRPSEVTDVYWIYAERNKGNYPPPNKQSGKWLIFLPEESVDETWSFIREATEEGRLGDSSKVATAKPSSLRKDSRKRVICVYTYDWKDEEDVRRVRQELRKLGFTAKMPYKADQDTLDGKYRFRGNTRMSKYYE